MPNAARSKWLSPLLVCLGVTLVMAFETWLIAHQNGGHFLYTTDDAYIHLSMSEQIARGGYGVNPGEYAAASSSILFPFLLAPFAGFAFQSWMPLVISYLANLGSGVLLLKIFDRAGLLKPAAAPILSAALALALMLAANVVGVAFTGLEHDLHVVFVLASIYGLLVFLEEDRCPWWLIASLIAAPLIRYEALALSVAILAVLAYRGAWRAALTGLVAILLLVGGFSAFLLGHGLPALPSSVLSKSNSVAAHSIAGKIADILSNVAKVRLVTAGVVISVFAVAVAGVFAISPAWRRLPLGNRPLVALVGLVAVLGHMALGHFGWVYRYEVYILTIVGVLALYLTAPMIGAVAAESRPTQAVYAVLAVLILAVGQEYVFALLKEEPLSSNFTYRHNYQMHRFLAGYYKGPVAVNDLGQTSYRYDLPVVDLWGLGDDKARRFQAANDQKDVLAMVTDRHVCLVLSYPGVVIGAPADWRVVGEIKFASNSISYAPHSRLWFTAAGPACVDPIRQALIRYAPTTPPGDTLQIFPTPQPIPASDPTNSQ